MRVICVTFEVLKTWKSSFLCIFYAKLLLRALFAENINTDSDRGWVMHNLIKYIFVVGTIFRLSPLI